MNIKHHIEQSIQGNVRAQRALFDLYSASMLQLCKRYIKDSHEAEDAFIKAFNKVFEHLHTFEYRGENSLQKWIGTIMINECLMILRKTQRFETVNEDQLYSAENSVQPSDEESIYQLILELPLGYRTVFNLYVIEGYAHKEIAKMLDISEGTSKSQLNKARKLLQHNLEKLNLSYGT